MKTISDKAGLPPGTLIHVGHKKTDKVNISVMNYNFTDFSLIQCKSPEECFPFRDKEDVSWINIEGLHNTGIIESIGNHFGLHMLLLEDVLNTRHRPKFEDFDEYLFVMLKMLNINEDDNTIVSENISFVLSKNWLISFQEMEGDIFNGLRDRTSKSKGIIRKLQVDYLLYRLIDTIVDNYFVVTEQISEATEDLEVKVLDSPDKQTLQEIQHLKKQLIFLRKAVYPLREVVSALQKSDNNLIQENTYKYLHDVYEHIIQVTDFIENQRDILSGLMDLYHSEISSRMNKVMHVLTIIATIFIPLTFIAGIYGMNFDNMPELHWKYGYFFIWALMIIVVLVMIIYFRKKKWIL